MENIPILCRLSPEAVETLKQIAQEYGFIYAGRPQIGAIFETLAKEPKILKSSLNKAKKKQRKTRY